jgi:hypothetical protein
MSCRTRILLGSGLAVLVGVAGLTILVQPKPTPKPAPKTGAQPGVDTRGDLSGKVVATVNGEPIHGSEIMAALPIDAYQEQLEDLKKAKFKRLVEEAIESQFLEDHKVAVSDEDLKNGTQEFERMVKTPGCPCCGGGYENLEQFRKVNAFTALELRRRISCDTGMKLYTERLVKERTSPQALEEAAKKDRARIETTYAEAYVISFGDMRAPGNIPSYRATDDKRETLANDALRRLKKGDSFEEVAKEMSEDKASAPKGGALGCVRASSLGREVGQILAKLEPGTYSGVIKETWGYCIVMRKKLTEEDIVSVVKEEARYAAQGQVFQEFMAARNQAKILYGFPPASAPAPASGGSGPS